MVQVLGLSEEIYSNCEQEVLQELSTFKNLFEGQVKQLFGLVPLHVKQVT